jgi:hypothetical protein
MHKSSKSLALERKKAFRVGVRFSHDDLRQLECNASVPGLANIVMNATVNEKKGRAYKVAAEFIRRAALGAELPRPIPSLSLKGYVGLQRIGNNINQIAKILHSMQTEDELLELMRSFKDDLRGMAQQLMGIDESDIERYFAKDRK